MHPLFVAITVLWAALFGAAVVLLFSRRSHHRAGVIFLALWAGWTVAGLYPCGRLLMRPGSLNHCAPQMIAINALWTLDRLWPHQR